MATPSLEAIRNAAPAILPSLLRCDFGDLKSEVARLAEAGTEILHLDVMDGHFVPNLTYGMPIVEGLRRHTDMPLDVHLMISDPLEYAKPMVDAGADLLTFHIEAIHNRDAVETVERIRELGVGVGVALNPETPLSTLAPCLPIVDMVLVMSVEAGFGGQAFNPVALEKLRVLREAVSRLAVRDRWRYRCRDDRAGSRGGLRPVRGRFGNLPPRRLSQSDRRPQRGGHADEPHPRGTPHMILRPPRTGRVLLIRPGATQFR